VRTQVLLLIGIGAVAVGLTPAQEPPKKKLDVEIEVPYVPTPQKVVDKMLELAAVKDGQTVYDLGCGDGRIVITAVKQFKAGKGLGVDFNPERLKDCEKSMDAAGLSPDQRKKLTFKQGDVLKMTPEDFKDVDVVTLYLLPEVNLKLKPVLQKGLKKGARVVSHAFDMGDWAPDKTVQVVDGESYERTVHLWTIK
jgi:SAM-dependent methyltransferase